ncbi:MULTISPECIES: DNA repair protein [Vibrio]|uniref:DNA repair protein n=1 Tax=Vibrio cortegadensis TaxID=1328770 RepID=A0ABV4M2K3_9VIBR|nr:MULTISPECIES: DNA repair protein [Vibrio]MDN3698614.1 DNA repair protein [Vibrio cortegadensis]NOH83249.1 DNA repair protein [Vibrio sp. 03-59-1]TKF23776.1 DNA repair protein [Vibrio genomosp. F6]
MNIGLIIALVAVLLVLVLGYNIMLQYKMKVETSKKQESSRYLTLIDATEDLIGNAHHVPFSKDLLVCLNTRILDALENMYQLDPRNKQLAQRIVHTKQQITQLKENYPDGDTTSFKVPSSDKQAIVMLKLVKRLRDTVRNEHNKGRFETQAYVAENARLETIQIRINIENVVKRAKDSIARGQTGTAVQLLRKGIDALSTKNDAYSNQAREKLQLMLNELDKKRQVKNAEDLQQIEEKERDDDMDALFGEKKKW